MNASPLKDMTGKVFGRWTVVSYSGKKRWLCRCNCGEERSVIGTALRDGSSTSCGCLRKENALSAVVTHGMYATSIYKIRTQIIQRCHNPNSYAYQGYGGRGISVCQSWRDSFEAFLEDMGPRPSPQHSIDRIDNDGNYEPGNVRWATAHEQLLNRRNNRRFHVNGDYLTMGELCAKHSCNENTVEKRLRLGWSIEDALFIPVKKHSK